MEQESGTSPQQIRFCYLESFLLLRVEKQFFFISLEFLALRISPFLVPPISSSLLTSPQLPPQRPGGELGPVVRVQRTECCPTMAKSRAAFRGLSSERTRRLAHGGFPLGDVSLTPDISSCLLTKPASHSCSRQGQTWALWAFSLDSS